MGRLIKASLQNAAKPIINPNYQFKEKVQQIKTDFKELATNGIKSDYNFNEKISEMKQKFEDLTTDLKFSNASYKDIVKPISNLTNGLETQKILSDIYSFAQQSVNLDLSQITGTIQSTIGQVSGVASSAVTTATGIFDSLAQASTGVAAAAGATSAVSEQSASEPASSQSAVQEQAPAATPTASESTPSATSAASETTPTTTPSSSKPNSSSEGASTKPKEEQKPTTKPSSNNNPNSTKYANVKNGNVIDTNTPVTSGKQYSLSDDELAYLAYVAKQEQGSVEGAKVELSLMANQYERSGSSKEIDDYIRNSKWYASGSRTGYSYPGDSYVQAARDVLSDGNRYVGSNVVEHDYMGDITSISTGSKSNRSNYIPGETVITNCYGAKYVFVGFAPNNGDPFGYLVS